MFCEKCGKQLDDGSRFCKFCSAQQPPFPYAQVPQTPAQPPQRSKGKKWLIPVIALVAAAAVAAVLLSVLRQGPEKTAAAPETEETVTLYLLTGRTQWHDSEKVSQTVVEYDELGRPTRFSLDSSQEYMDMDCSVSYDSHGNRTEEAYTNYFQSAPREISQEYDYSYDSNGNIRKCTVYNASSEKREKLLSMDFTCDSRGNILHVEYDLGSATYGNAWDHYVYDSQGRLLQETFCIFEDLSVRPGSQIPEHIYDSNLTRYCYTYDENGDPDSIRRSSARVTGPEIVAYNEVNDTEFVVAEEHSVELRNGHILVQGHEDLLDKNGNPSTPGDVFDSHGNLLREEDTYSKKVDGQTVEGREVIEYTYEKVELPLSDARKAQRLMESCCLPSEIAVNSIYYFGDAAMGWRTRPIALHLLSGYTKCYYYLIPNPIC